ncbi:MAG: hypothetical protein Fur0025_21840 [Oscillatoriaceae cyanobacterium]
MAGEQISKIDALLQLMGDGQWHYPPDLTAVSHRFGDTIDRARRKGYLIETERLKGNNYRYRLVGHKDEKIWAEFQGNWQPDSISLSAELPSIEGCAIEQISLAANGCQVFFDLKYPDGQRSKLIISSQQLLNFSQEY